jgi:hypothetical protein
MEIQQIFNAIFGSLTNIIAAIVITILMLIALFGMFRKSTNHKVKHFARQSPAILATVGIFFSFWGISIGLIGLDLNDCQWPTELSHYWPLILSHFPREKSLIQF